MKKITMILCTIMISSLLASCGSSKANEKFVGNENAKNKIIEYGDYKCPYCKEVEEHIMPKIKKDYIDKHKANYQYVNMAFLGDDSL
ncbi:protein-disulfide isomerase, partial [Staphylococcus equorum]|uniref:thioredoxin domain-containing protein n=1 Tax=Staphylococcus equorum TaxID=246432 RepID=UPI000D4DAABD